MTQRPMLGDLDLETVRRIEDGEGQVLVRHEVPALEGDFLQRRGRDGARVALTGVVTGPGSAERLRELRVKVRAAEPVPFLSDVTTATRLRQVLVERLDARELAGHPERYEVTLALREYTESPTAESGTEELPGAASVEQEADAAARMAITERVEQVVADVGSLRVRVETAVEAGLAHLAVEVVAVSGGEVERTFLLTEPEDGVFGKEDLPAGEYQVRVVRV